MLQSFFWKIFVTNYLLRNVFLLSFWTLRLFSFRWLWRKTIIIILIVWGCVKLANLNINLDHLIKKDIIVSNMKFSKPLHMIIENSTIVKMFTKLNTTWIFGDHWWPLHMIPGYQICDNESGNLESNLMLMIPANIKKEYNLIEGKNYKKIPSEVPQPSFFKAWLSGRSVLR